MAKLSADDSYCTGNDQRVYTWSCCHDWKGDLSNKITSCSPYSLDPALRNIGNGTVAKDDVNVHEYKSIGIGIISRMVGQPVFSVSFQ